MEKKLLDIIFLELNIKQLAKYFSIPQLDTMYVDECDCSSPEDKPNKERNAKIEETIVHITKLTNKTQDTEKRKKEYLEKWFLSKILLNELPIDKLALHLTIPELRTMFVEECDCDCIRDKPNKERNTKIRKTINFIKKILEFHQNMTDIVKKTNKSTVEIYIKVF